MIKKMVLIALIAALGLVALPTANVYASGLEDEISPPERPEMTGEQLEQAWQRALKAYDRAGKIIERADAMTEKIQTLIDKANEHDLDTTAVQAALDAFNNALKDAHPVYESAKGIINSHQGFDADGKVTDFEKAKETAKELGETLRDLRQMTSPSGQALRDAIQAFREANPRPERPERPAGDEPTFAPSASS